jgi:hypothetical protein
MSLKKTSPKDKPSKDYTSGIIWINTDSKPKKASTTNAKPSKKK